MEHRSRVGDLLKGGWWKSQKLHITVSADVKCLAKETVRMSHFFSLRT